jgi:hypothetical protein
MEPPRLMEELLRVAERLGLEVRVEPFATAPVRAGGLCWVQGRQLVLVDENAPIAQRASALAEALSAIDLEGLYVAPEARRLVEAARRRLLGRPAAQGCVPAPGQNVSELGRPKPGLRSTTGQGERDRSR